MKYIFFTVIILFGALCIRAQYNDQIDSLMYVINHTENDTIKIRTYLYVGDIYIYDIPDSALIYYEKALILTEKAIDNLTVLTNLKNGLNDQSLKTLTLLKATSLHYLGIVYYIQSRYDIAIETLIKSIEISEKIDDKQRMSACWTNIGNVYDEQGIYDKAIEHYLKAYKIKEEIGDKRGMVICYANTGIVYSNQGIYEKAHEYFLKSTEIAEEMCDKGLMAACYSNVAISFENQENFNKAIEYHQKSLLIYSESDEKRGMSACFNNLGNIYRIQLKYDEASENLKKALKLKEELGDRNGIARTGSNIASLHILIADKKRSIDSVISQNDESYAHLDSALQYGKKSMKIAREIAAMPTIQLNNSRLAETCWGMNKNAEAAEYFTDLIRIDNENILLNFSFLAEGEKDDFFKAIEEHYWRFNSFALKYKTTSPEIVELVYNNTLKNKGLLLKSNTAMRNAVNNSKDTALIKKYEEWIELRKEIAKLYADGKDTKQFEDTSGEIEAYLVKNSNEFSDFQKVQEISWKDVQKNLKENEVAIEFLHFRLFNPDSSLTDFTESVQYAALIISQESVYPEMVELFEEKQLEGILNKFSDKSENYINNDLYDLIWKPIENYINDSKIVYISPEGLLHKVSFSAIAREKNVFLCDNYNLIMNSSTGNICMSDEYGFNQTFSAILFGGINYNSDSTDIKVWNFLEGTKNEVNILSKYLKKRKIDVSCYSSDTATETKFKEIASTGAVIHVATHGFFYPDPELKQSEKQSRLLSGENGNSGEEITFRGSDGFGLWMFVQNINPMMRSGLVFAAANDVWNMKTQTLGDDGVLTALEVVSIDLRNTELVVLSACETGLGDIKGSEGVYGLQRAFKMAGVKYIIMSLWQVPDKETVEFMEMFYKKLLKLKDVRLAFNETQKEIRKKYDPYYWAAFVLIE